MKTKIEPFISYHVFVDNELVPIIMKLNKIYGKTFNDLAVVCFKYNSINA